MPRPDPIVEEVHLARDAMASASDNDLEKIAAAARARQAAGGRKVVRLPPKRVAAQKQTR